MGLDITAYRQVALAPNAAVDAGGYPEDYDNHMRVWSHPDFTGRLEGLTDRAIYTTGTESHDFRAGSYSGYNRWREELAKLAGYDAGDYTCYGTTRQSHCVPCWNGATGPFAELINFSDCEGIIGPVVSAKLARDFAEFQGKADAHTDEWFREKYADWRKAFDLAADGGLVDFH